ncbi:MAG: 6-methylsalicylate decarboxylase [Solirubrobacteraceae bacterium]|nr:6-methylsalicylate decarboxylase [Solirubrobacteraceae bacterium]
MPPLLLDVHQHLWPEPFLAALARRSEPPCLRRGGDGWLLRLAGEPEAAFDPAPHDPAARAATVAADGIDAALLCLSTPLGIETLPSAEAQPVLDAWHDGVFALGEPFGVWGAVGLDGTGPEAVDALLDRGAVGITLPAGALASPTGVERVGALLEGLERRGRPLLVHPGAAPAGTPAEPWWAPAVSYVSELHAAWHGFAAWARPALPRLRVVFVGLAGGAPLHVERLAGRGGPAAAAFDPLTFYDTSSYGPRAIEAVGGVVGIDQLVYGSDRPVLDAPTDPALGPAGEHALRAANPARLLAGEPVAA